MTDLKLNQLFQALIQVYQKDSLEIKTPEHQALKVSRTVSFFAFWYERMRNSIEYREDHLIRRAAIERIFKRRILLNPEGARIAEPLIRELLWARYLPNQMLSENKIPMVQSAIDKYIALAKEMLSGRSAKEQNLINQFVMDLLTCEIEEILAPDERREAFVNFVYQSLLSQIDLPDERLNKDKSILLYSAVDFGFAKSDKALMRYHLAKILLPELTSKTGSAEKALPHFMNVVNHIEATINNKAVEKLRLFVKRNSAPFLILRDLLEANPKNFKTISATYDELKVRVDQMCRKRYKDTREKLTRAGIRSIIYIFLTKMVFAFLLEFPVDRLLRQDIEYLPLTINIIFPPFLMFLIVAITGIPGADNTTRIFERINYLVRSDISLEKTVIKIKQVDRRPLLTFVFSIIYLLTFIISFGAISIILTMLHFNIVSQLIFIFFVSMVLFFAYRIRQTSKEYLLVEKEGIFSPIKDFFTLPILSLGKWLSGEIARLNIFIFIFDFIVEAPFKAIFEIGEEWINFVKTKKDEFA
ncbi:hypothetical protein HYT02_05660 [Candidatus Gottesmanbacteria bacterium]|nr:hypothetical protein [Candidatus Gottesmanbacteria bacterium]